MAAILPALSNLLQGRFPRRILYGHSQGGYAAIKFSRALGATTVLAFSPQYSIDRRLIADERVNKYYTGQRHAGMWPEPRDTAGSIFLFYDPYDAADTAHANRIGEALPVLPVKISPSSATPAIAASATRIVSRACWPRPATVTPPECAASSPRERAVRVERSVLMALRLADKRPRTAAAILQKHWRRLENRPGRQRVFPPRPGRPGETRVRTRPRRGGGGAYQCKCAGHRGADRHRIAAAGYRAETDRTARWNWNPSARNGSTPHSGFATCIWPRRRSPHTRKPGFTHSAGRPGAACRRTSFHPSKPEGSHWPSSNWTKSTPPTASRFATGVAGSGNL
ncbi:MAG: hypothetical protein WDN04_17090 [Rhodospirillales bacterium]